MDPDRWQSVQKLFLAAGELQGDQRAAFLDQACVGDDALRRRVDALLEAEGRAEGRIEGAIEGVLRLAAGDASESRSETGRERIGAYRIIEELGRGGLSTVYLAERDDEHYRMRVAVKVIRRGMDTDDILARLRQERQILASLDHPYVARLLDGGSTDDGSPYVVMEYIRGEPIDAYCDRHRLSIRARLELFVKVCAAVGYAHRSLVIHRDIKPGNLLVTDEGVPKLLDFGIAKLLDPGLVPHPVAPTATVVRLLTPEYASPEQVRGETLTTATDVYSLGVLLYVLLAGRPPYRLETRRPQELERVICDTEPERPSTVAGQSAPEPLRQTRRSTPERLRRRLRGDLDNIVLTALEKEPRQRYPSVEQLAEDIRRYLEARPVLARKPTLRYRCGKFVRRHRMGVTVAALLLAGFAATLWQARIAVAQRSRAELNLARAQAQQNRAEQVSSFLSDLFELSDPSEALGERITAREILDRGRDKLVRGDLEQDPEVRAALLSTMGEVYQNLALYDEASPLLTEALELRRRAASPDVAASLVELALLRFDQGDVDGAEPLLREALEQQIELFGERHRDVAASLAALGYVMEARNDLDAAEAYYRQALELRREILGRGHAEIADSLNDLGELLYRKNDLDAAEAYLLQALERRREILDEAHPALVTSLNNLAVLRFEQEEHEAAERLLREVLRLRRKVLGEDHPEVAVALNNLAAVVAARGDLEGAELLYRQALAIDRSAKGDVHRDVATGLINLAVVLEKREELDAAEDLLREALDIRRALWGERDTVVALTAHRLAGVVAAQGRSEAAESLYRESLRALRITVPAGDLNLSYPLVRLGRLLIDLDRAGEAEPLLREAVEIRRAGAASDDRLAEAEAALADCRKVLGR